MENTTYWVHNLDPFLVQFAGEFGIRWYGLAYLTGFILGYWTILKIARSGRSPLNPELVSDLITYLVMGVMVGGRVGYCLFYSPDLLTDFRPTFPFWGVLAVWEGGMASHGGIIGVALACWLFARKYKIPFMHVGDLTIFGGSIGIMCGRIANFINGELVGRPISGHVPWAVKFPNDMFSWLNTRDISLWQTEFKPKLLALTESAKTLGVDPIEWSRWVETYAASTPARREINMVIHRLHEAIMSGNETVRQLVGQVLDPRHPSQLYAALSEGLIPFLIVLIIWRRPLKPGVVSALFLALYPISRVINEMFRMPDAHIGYQWLGLTRGQWLSIGMMAFSLLYLFWALRQNAKPLGGWQGPATVAVATPTPRKKSK